MATTTNFGWDTPDDTDLVKDGALAIRTLGSAIDTSLVDLKGGTTGQVLSKTSNTDMDFTWVTSDDANAIQNAIVDAKGDLITATAADTPSRIAVGNDGETLVADSSATTGLRWQSNFAAGKSKVINGAFDHWQRGTSFTLSSGVDTYCADRFMFAGYGSGTAATVTRQTFTAGTAPVAGYEGQFFARLTNFATASAWQIRHRIEDVRTFAGQTVTLSYWAKSSTNINNNISIFVTQNFGSGGSTKVDTSFGTTGSTTGSWVRYSYTVAVPSVAGKTIGAGSYVEFTIFEASGAANSNQIDTWGWQVENGNTATAFQTATGTLAGELHVCKRYYEKSYNIGTTPGTNTGTGSFYYGGTTNVSNNVFFQIPFSAEKRGTPTMTFYTTSGTSGQLTYARSGVGATNATATGYQIGTTTAGVYVGAGAQYVACELGGHWVAEAEL